MGLSEGGGGEFRCDKNGEINVVVVLLIGNKQRGRERRDETETVATYFRSVFALFSTPLPKFLKTDDFSISLCLSNFGAAHRDRGSAMKPYCSRLPHSNLQSRNCLTPPVMNHRPIIFL